MRDNGERYYGWWWFTVARSKLKVFQCDRRKQHKHLYSCFVLVTVNLSKQQSTIATHNNSRQRPIRFYVTTFLETVGYPWMGSGTVGVNCLAQGHNTMPPFSAGSNQDHPIQSHVCRNQWDTVLPTFFVCCQIDDVLILLKSFWFCRRWY